MKLSKFLIHSLWAFLVGLIAMFSAYYVWRIARDESILYGIITLFASWILLNQMAEHE